MILDQFTKNILKKHNAKIIFDKEDDRLRVYVVSDQSPSVKGYISLYLNDESTYETSSVVADKGLGQLMYSLAAMKLAEDGFWVSPSTTGDTNKLALNLWDKLKKNENFRSEIYKPLEENIADSRITTYEDLEQFSSYIQETTEENIYSLRAEGQMLFDIMYRRAEEQANESELNL